MLFLCKLPPGHQVSNNEPDKTLLRVYFNPETESHLVAESVIFTLLSERELGPQLFGIFNGGRLEEFIVVIVFCRSSFTQLNLIQFFCSLVLYHVRKFANPKCLKK